MSQTNNTGGESAQGDPITEEFDFFFPAAKSLALDLSTPEDTSIAAAWVQKLEAEQPQSEEEKLTRLNYLKLLLFVLQRGRLSGMFKKQPPSGSLQPFPPGVSILEMGEMLLNQDDTPTCGEGDARCLPYSIDLSNDLREFVASQEIPNFGVQMYYAWSSDEPIHKWLCFDEEKFPQFVLDKIKLLKEIKSDENASAKSGCKTTQKGCELPVLDKCSRKKVKSPQEIEKAQGRSFHAYMGLVGRMGFNEKCGDDSDKSQRRDQRKGNNCSRNMTTNRCPGSGGEIEVEEIPSEDGRQNAFPDGLNPVNRPCFCLVPGHPMNPFLHGRRGPQHFPDNCPPQYPDDAYEFNLYGNPGTGQAPPRRRYNAEPQCPENSPAQAAQSQRKNSSSPRPKSSCSNRSNANCPPQGNGGGVCNQNNACSCTTQACTCPCPRPMRKTPSATNVSIGGRVGMGPCPGPSNQDASGYARPCPTNLQGQRQGQGQGQGQCQAQAQGQGPGPAVCPAPNAGTRGPRILHCYDGQNPDQRLTLKVSGLPPSHHGGPIDVSVVNSYPASPCPGAESPAQGQSVGGTCRTPQGQGQAPPPSTPCEYTTVKHINVPESSVKTSQRPPCNKPTRSPSPQPGPRPVCEAAEQSQQQYKQNQQVTFYPHQHPQNAQICQENQGPMAGQVQPGFSGGQASESTCGARPPSQSGQRPRPQFGQTPSSFAVANNSGCLANMANLLQGIKQKTEAHRVKCDQPGSRRPGMNDAASCQVTCQQAANVCPQSAPPPCGSGCPNCSHDSRPPRPQVCPDSGTAASAHGYSSYPGAGHEKRISLSQKGQQCPQTNASRLQGQCDDEDQGESESDSSENEGACPVSQNAGPSAGQPCPGTTGQAKELLPDMDTYACRRITKKNLSAPEPNTYREPLVYTSSRNTRPVCPQGVANQQTGGQAVQQQQWAEPSPGAGPAQCAMPGLGIGPTPSTSKFTAGGRAKGQSQRKGPEMQTCTPQKSGQRRPTAQEQDSDEWEEPPTGFSIAGPYGGGVDPFFFGSESQVAAMAGETEGLKAQREERRRQGQNENAWGQPGPNTCMPQTFTGQGNNRQYGGGVEPLFFGSESQVAAMAGETETQKAQREERRRQGPNAAINQNENTWTQPGPSSCMQQAIPGQGNDSRHFSGGVDPFFFANKSQLAAAMAEMDAKKAQREERRRQGQNAAVNQNEIVWGQPGSSSCTPQAIPGLGNNRIQTSQNRLSRQKSNSRTNKTATNTSWKTVGKSQPGSSKSETRRSVSADKKSKSYRKSERISSKSEMKSCNNPESKLKIESKTKGPFKSETQMRNKFEPNTKFKSYSNLKNTGLSKDPRFQSKRKNQQAPFVNQVGPSCAVQPGPSCAVQPGPSCAIQGNAPQPCNVVDDSIPNCTGNPYREKSLVYHRKRPPLIKISTPTNWMGGRSNDDLISLSAIQNSTCGDIHDLSTRPANAVSEESMEFIPISNTLNPGRTFHYSPVCRRRLEDEWQVSHNTTQCSDNGLEESEDGTIYQTFTLDEQPSDVGEISDIRQCSFY